MSRILTSYEECVQFQLDDLAQYEKCIEDVNFDHQAVFGNGLSVIQAITLNVGNYRAIKVRAYATEQFRVHNPDDNRELPIIWDHQKYVPWLTE